jgi:DNA helicase-2/ATP-dependent DNA helicase PcrA
MRERLGRLGVEGVRASTFHSAALAQLRALGGEPPGQILASKALLLRQIANALPKPFRFRPAGDLATEVEWAKARRVTPEAYRRELGEHQPPIPDDLMARVYREYEQRKRAAGHVDFEDLLELAIRLLDEGGEPVRRVRERYRAFTVDEYQDVNVLQETLLRRWLGDRDDLCVVGDDYQSIYAFTGASAQHLLELPRRFPGALVVRLERNYRSTPQVLELANRLVPKLGGAEKRLTAVSPPGPPPTLEGFATAAAEDAALVARVRALVADGVPLESMAVLVRTNARAADFEEVFHDAKIPFQGAALLARDGARQLLKGLRGREDDEAATVVPRVARAQGLLETPPDGLGEREQTRQADLARLVRLAEELDGTVVEFVAELQRRFGEGVAGRGLHLLTLHRAKGLEFDAVFLPRVEERELPIRRARGDEVAEERRLLYVGMTRARTQLAVSWSGKPSRFLAELGVEPAPRRPAVVREEQPAAFHVLREWRRRRAQVDEVPAYVVFHDATLAEIARRSPQSLAELATVPGVGPAKLQRYGDEVLRAVAG